MKGIEYLDQIKVYDVIIKQKENEKKEIEDKIYNISAIDNSKPKVKTSSNRNPYLIDKCLDDITALDAEIADYNAKKNSIINKIRKLKKGSYIDILYKRYAEFKSFNIIAKEMGYSVSNTWKLHSKAIKEFEKLYSKL